MGAMESWGTNQEKTGLVQLPVQSGAHSEFSSQ